MGARASPHTRDFSQTGPRCHRDNTRWTAMGYRTTDREEKQAGQSTDETSRNPPKLPDGLGIYLES